MPPKSPKKVVAKKAKKAKKVKDPNAPKRAMSSYMYWMQQEGRDAAKGKLGAGATIGEVAKEVRRKEKHLDEARKVGRRSALSECVAVYTIDALVKTGEDLLAIAINDG